MNLTQVLQLAAAQIKCDANELLVYAAEDTLGGFHINEAERKWPMGSCWGVEGQILYALTRYRKPEVIVEIGGLAGCGTSHLALAVQANGRGRVISLDNGTLEGVHGALIPADLRQYVTLVRANGEDWLAEQADHSIGLIFEDATHSTELVALLSSLALRKLQPGGILVNHDAMHDFAWYPGGVKAPSDVGLKVRDGLAQANAYFTPYLAEPSDCGIALTVAPGVWQAAAVFPDDSPDTLIDDVLAAGFMVGTAPIESEVISPDVREGTELPPAKAKRGRKPKAK